MKIEIQYFAMLREKANTLSEELISNHATYGELYQSLNEKYGFGLPASMIQVAVNDEFSSMGNPVIEGAKVVFIPPVAGG